MQIESNTSACYAVNARFLAHRVTGVQRYAREIASRLQGEPAMLAPKNGKGVRGHLWEQWTLPRLAAGRLLWSPCGAGPLNYKRQVVTIHDLFPIEHPEWYNGAFAQWYQHMLGRLSTNAAHLIAVSHYTKDRIVHLLGRNPDDITVVHNGPVASIQLTSALDASRSYAALALPSRRYVLSLSSLESRKNLRGLLEAWRVAQRSLGDNVWLVLAGQQADISVFGRQQLPSIPPRVHFTGYVPEQHLAGLYSGASLFVYPSLAEGFGLPVLEAMRCGLRVVTSNTTSLPEVGGDAAEYVNPGDPRDLAAAILRNLPPKCAASAPYEPSLAQASRFSWDVAARRTEEVLRQAGVATPSAVAANARTWSVA